MADSDKDVLITPNTSVATTHPEIKFVGKDNSPVYAKILDDNSVSFEGTEGQILTINPILSTGDIFSVNDISGMQSIVVNADGTIALAPVSGNVGIGTTSPQSQLDIRGAAGSPGHLTLATDELTVVDGDILGRIDFNAPVETTGTDAILVGAAIWAEADDTFAADNNETELVFATAESGAATEKMRLTKNGRLGIGTTSAYYHLDVHGSGEVWLKALSTDNAAGIILNSDNSNEWKIYTPNSSDNLRFYRGANNVEFTDDGKVGIGTITPNQELTIDGTMSLKEQASASPDTAAYGQIWVKTATPNQLWFTNDAGTDVQLGGGGGELSSDETPQLYAGATLDTNSGYIVFDDDHGIQDSNANEMLWFQQVSSSTDYLQLHNATNDASATSTERYSGPLLKATGSSTHVGMRFQTKGRGVFTFLNDYDDANAGPEMHLWRKNSSGDARGDAIGKIVFKGAAVGTGDEFNNQKNFVSLKAIISEISASLPKEAGRLEIATLINDEQHTIAQFGRHDDADDSNTADISGAALLRTQVYEVSGATSLTHDDHAGRILRVTGAVTITLPTTGVNKGDQYVVLNDVAGTVTISPQGTDTINGANSSVTIANRYDAKTFIALEVDEWLALG